MNGKDFDGRLADLNRHHRKQIVFDRDADMFRELENGEKLEIRLPDPEGLELRASPQFLDLGIKNSRFEKGLCKYEKELRAFLIDYVLARVSVELRGANLRKYGHDFAPNGYRMGVSSEETAVGDVA